MVVVVVVVAVVVVVVGVVGAGVLGMASVVGAMVVVVVVVMVVLGTVGGEKGGRRVANTKASVDSITERGREQQLSISKCSKQHKKYTSRDHKRMSRDYIAGQNSHNYSAEILHSITK